MNENKIKAYLELLGNKMVVMFGLSKEDADHAIQNSAIQTLIREEPEYVDHVPISSWAEEIHREMFT